MRFPHVLTRYSGSVPTGGKALGSDASPAFNDPIFVGKDNYFAMKTTTPSGFSLQGLLVAYNGPAASCSVSLFAFETSTQSWQTIQAAVPITRCVPTRVQFGFPSEMGGVDILLVPATSTGEAGAYMFAMAPVHSS